MNAACHNCVHENKCSCKKKFLLLNIFSSYRKNFLFSFKRSIYINLIQEVKSCSIQPVRSKALEDRFSHK